MVSQDGLRQFRPPSYKPNLDQWQANFEWRRSPNGAWQGNGHLNYHGPAVRAVLRRFHSPDADLDLYAPGDPEDVGVLVQMMVGPAGKPGEESFDVVVCTPRWLDRWVRENGPLIGRHHLVVERWDFARIRLYLTEAVESEEAATWPEVAAKIGRIGKWEFEDYRP